MKSYSYIYTIALLFAFGSFNSLFAMEEGKVLESGSKRDNSAPTRVEGLEPVSKRAHLDGNGDIQIIPPKTVAQPRSQWEIVQNVLYPELLVHVFPFLEVSDLVRVAKTSKGFCRALYNPYSWTGKSVKINLCNIPKNGLCGYPVAIEVVVDDKTIFDGGMIENINRLYDLIHSHKPRDLTLDFNDCTSFNVLDVVNFLSSFGTVFCTRHEHTDKKIPSTITRITLSNFDCPEDSVFGGRYAPDTFIQGLNLITSNAVELILKNCYLVVIGERSTSGLVLDLPELKDLTIVDEIPLKSDEERRQIDRTKKAVKLGRYSRGYPMLNEELISFVDGQYCGLTTIIFKGLKISWFVDSERKGENLKDFIRIFEDLQWNLQTLILQDIIFCNYDGFDQPTIDCAMTQEDFEIFLRSFEGYPLNTLIISGGNWLSPKDKREMKRKRQMNPIYFSLLN